MWYVLNNDFIDRKSNDYQSVVDELIAEIKLS